MRPASCIYADRDLAWDTMNVVSVDIKDALKISDNVSRGVVLFHFEANVKGVKDQEVRPSVAVTPYVSHSPGVSDEDVEQALLGEARSLLAEALSRADTPRPQSVPQRRPIEPDGDMTSRAKSQFQQMVRDAIGEIRAQVEADRAGVWSARTVLDALAAALCDDANRYPKALDAAKPA